MEEFSRRASFTHCKRDFRERGGHRIQNTSDNADKNVCDRGDRPRSRTKVFLNGNTRPVNNDVFSQPTLFDLIKKHDTKHTIKIANKYEIITRVRCDCDIFQ